VLQEHDVDAVVQRTRVIDVKLENISTVLLMLFEDEMRDYITSFR